MTLCDGIFQSKVICKKLSSLSVLQIGIAPTSEQSSIAIVIIPFEKA